MRRLGAALAVVVVALGAGGCARGSSGPSAEEQARERFQWAQVCRQWRAEITERLGGKPLDDPEQFKDVFNRMAEDQGAPEDFRKAVEEAWESRPSSDDADPEEFAEQIEKLRNKCRDVGFAIE